MSRKRFEEIRYRLHFANNDEQPSQDEPSYMNKAFVDTMSETKCQAIDEHMIKFKGHDIMKQYKLWCRCDSQTTQKIGIYTAKKRGGG